MTAPNDGGPAFPLVGNREWNISPEYGMSLRDYFAAKAMQGICASGPSSAWTDDRIADNAYRLAGAMLKAREAQP